MKDMRQSGVPEAQECCVSESRATFGPCPKVEQDPPAAISTAFSSAEGGQQTGGGGSGI